MTTDRYNAREAEPRLDLTETWQRGNQPVFVFGSILAQRNFTEANFAIDALNHPDPVSNFRTGISVEQLVFDGVRTLSANRSAAIGEEIADAGSRDTTAMLRLGATTAYGEVLMAQANRAASAAALVLGAAALGHIYLAVGHPSSRAALSGMLTGLVSRKWALGHHRKWAESQGDD